MFSPTELFGKMHNAHHLDPATINHSIIQYLSPAGCNTNGSKRDLPFELATRSKDFLSIFFSIRDERTPTAA